MTEQELLEKITKASNGDWKRENFIKNCLGYVIDNFDSVEPIIKKHWVDKEKKQIISSIGTGKCKNAFNGTGICKDIEDKER